MPQEGPALFDAAIRNQAGNYVTPTTASIAADAAQKSDITPADFSIVNEPGADSYPISGYSWALIYTHQASQATGQALVNLLDWLTHGGQAYAAATGYVPLPPLIQQLARGILQQVTGPGGARLQPDDRRVEQAGRAFIRLDLDHNGFLDTPELILAITEFFASRDAAAPGNVAFGRL